MNPFTIDVETAVELNLLDDYNKHDVHLKEAWRKHFNTLLNSELQTQQHTIARQRAESYLRSLIMLPDVQLSPQVVALFAQAREIEQVPNDDPEAPGFTPKRLSDQRLLIELCQLTGDWETAAKLINRYRTTLRSTR